MGLVQASGKIDSDMEFKLLNLNDVTIKINNTLGKIKEDFVYIGFLLWEVNYYKHYLAKGYSSIVEYAEKELNFKKSATYNFISVCEKFSCKREKDGYPSMFLDAKFKDFSFSQLVEIKTVPIEQLDSFSSDMSSRDIREKKKDLNKIPIDDDDNVIDVEYVHASVESENFDIPKDVELIHLDYKENVIKYLTERLEVMKELVKDARKKDKNSSQYFEFLGAFHEVDLLLDCINKDEI